MLPDYADIRSRLGEPLWWDDRGVPRYDPFRPDMCDVYAEYVAYMEVACQACGQRFRVAASISSLDIALRADDKGRHGVELPTAESVGSFRYGDPPRHADCPGETMDSIPVRVIEFWRRDFDAESGWRRMPEHEVTFDVRDPGKAHGGLQA